MTTLKDKKILLGVSGGIAAYKACEILRRLQDEGAEVRVVLTSSAQKFITPLTFQSLSGHPVHTDLFSLTEESEMGHIKLADEADLVLVAPATADLIARMAHGLADDLLTTLLLVTRAPVVLAPSMNVNMWEKSVTQENLSKLKKRGAEIIDPEEGELACGWVGKGRLADVEKIIEVVKKKSCKGGHAGPPLHSSQSLLSGKKVLINAGPTREYLDPVRFISNPSSGKMGFALAAEAAKRGAQVILIAGPVSLSTPEGVQRIDVTTAEEMLKNCERHFASADLFVASAAVGDYRFPQIAPQKLKKNEKKLKLDLEPNVDILKTLSAQKNGHQLVVGFAAETQDLLKNAEKKLKTKNLDMIIANDISQKEIGFSSEENQVTLLSPQNKVENLPQLAKNRLASLILDRVEKILSSKTQPY